MAERLLVVEDDTTLRELLSASLRLAGFEVRAVMTGAEAMEAVLHDAPDLVVLDVMLPDFDGFEVVRRLSGGRSGAPAPAGPRPCSSSPPGTRPRTGSAG